MTHDPTRREFIKKTALVLGMPALIPASALGRDGHVAPSNRINMGMIGIGPRGREVLTAFLKQPDAKFITVCDVQKSNRRTAKMMVDRAYNNEDCQSTGEMLELIGRDDIDALLIATGDRWHAVASILAVKAGKDVYSEKPCAITITECRELDEAVRLYGRVFQAGTQRRNVPNFRQAVELARSGRLGRIHTVHAGIFNLEEIHEWLPAEPDPAPEEVDWDRWLGPVPWRPYNQAYVRGQWRGHRDFDSGAKLLDWGAHTVDLCQWALDMDGTTPVEFTPDGQTIHARYANGAKLVMRLGGFKGEGEWLDLGSCPVRFEGETGWVEAGSFGKIVANPPSLLDGLVIDPVPGGDPSAHIRNFLDCIKSRNAPTANSRVMRSSHIACHAAAMSFILGRKLTFDPATESFVNNDEANRLRSRARRAPWHA
jgi:predicted dehydrogenase